MTLDDTISLGTWVRRQRRALDLTQHALAACVGCSAASIKKIEADERRPSRRMAERLAGCLQLGDDQHSRFIEVAQRERAVDTLPAARAGEALGALTIVPYAAPTTSFVGRTDELRTITSRLLEQGCRLLSVIGPGGVGKTRLALEAATALMAHYADGVVVVSLAEAEDAAAVAATVLRQLGLPLAGSIDAQTQLLHALRRRRLLLVLDNFEQLVREPASCRLVHDVLAAAPEVALLVTSRERLNLAAEWVLLLEGLPPEAAATLFADRARRVGQQLAPDAQAAVATICRLVDGLPLAVDLAAGWTRVLTPDQIALQLQVGPDVLRTRVRDVPERHRSFDALFDQSWMLLSAAEQTIYGELAVFRGGFDSAAAAAVTGADLPTLLGLVDKSMVRADGSGRFNLHPLARHDAARRLAAADATEDARRRHADYYFALVQQALDAEGAPAGRRWHDQVDAEYANIRSAWHWALDHGRWTALWSVARPLYTFWTNRGYWNDGRDLLQAAVQRAPPDSSGAYAEAVVALATLLTRTGRGAEALAYTTEGYRLALGSGDANAIAIAAMSMGMLSAPGLERERHFEAAVQAGQQAKNRRQLALTLLLYGDVLREQGAHEHARARYQQSLTLARALGDDAVAIYAQGNLGRLALLDGAIDQAAELFGRCVAQARATHNPTALADWLLRLGVVQVYRQEWAAAHAALAECVTLAEEVHHWYCLPNAQIWLAATLLARGESRAAKRMVQRSLAAYSSRLQALEAAHPSPGELVEALVVAAQIDAALGHGEHAATTLGCADALRARAPIDPWLTALDHRVREHLARTLEPVVLDAGMARGRATAVAAHVAALAEETNAAGGQRPGD